MTKSDVTMLGMWASPLSQKVRMALNLKSIDYEFIDEDLANKSQRLLEANPVHKKIPVLIHNGKSVCESLLIVQYIDEVWTANGLSLLPSDPHDRSTARFWAEYIDDKLFPCVRAMFLSVAYGEEAEKTAIPLEEANRSLAVLENMFMNLSKGNKFFGGDEIGYLDIVLGSYLGWFKMLKKWGNLSLIDESNTPRLFEWARRLSAVDAVKDVLPDADKLIEFAKAYAAWHKNANKQE